MMNTLSRKYHLAEKEVFVDGLPGCGKTLFSSLISSMDRVELLSYSYEVEHTCALHHLKKLPIDAAKTMVRLQTDLKLYNTMMGRDVNFRSTDLSSAINSHNPSRYIQRIFGPGDEKVPEIIRKENPILNFSVHNLLSYSEPIWRALKERCVFIEIVRHPLYMIRQQALNMSSLLETVRHFTVYYTYKGRELPYYVKGWEEEYLNSNSVERAIHMMDYLNNQTKIAKKKFKEEFQFQSKIITIPFENFVLNPNPWMDEISDIIGANILEGTQKMMDRQNVPRKLVADGLDIEIYRRCGWTPPQNGATERDELNVRREDAIRGISSEAIDIIDKLSNEYEDTYWNPGADSDKNRSVNYNEEF